MRPIIRSLAQRGLRLRRWDYRRGGVYFITLVTAGRRNVFGDVVDGVMTLNERGRAVMTCWAMIPTIHPGVRLGSIVVMPNHIHALIELPHRDLEAPASMRSGRARGTLGVIVGGFKAAVTRRLGLAPGSLWQRQFHDRIVRDQRDLEAFEEYIAMNPERWREDPENSDACPAR
jgi:putative transposase